jgi:hypothetical protein
MSPLIYMIFNFLIKCLLGISCRLPYFAVAQNENSDGLNLWPMYAAQHFNGL